MPVRVAINGFGRIGRCLAQIDHCQKRNWSWWPSTAGPIRNGTSTSCAMIRCTAAFPATVEARERQRSYINGKEVQITRILEPESLPWKELGVEIVLESTGAFRDRASNEGHLKAGAREGDHLRAGKKIDATFVYRGEPPGL